MYSTPAVVTTSSSWVVNTALGLLCDPTLFQFRALVARIDEPEALQDLRLAVGLHLSQVDRQRSVVLLVHLRSEEHTSELQSQSNLVCRLLLEKKTTSSDQKLNRARAQDDYATVNHPSCNVSEAWKEMTESTYVY